MRRLGINKDARTRTSSESRQTAREPDPVSSRRGAHSDRLSEILLCDDTTVAEGPGLAAVKEINRGGNSGQRQTSIGVKDVPAFMTESSISLAARRAVGNQRRDRFPTELIGSSDAVDEPVEPTAPAESLLLDSREVERLLGIGRTKVYELIASEQIPVVRIGRCVRVPRDELKAWITSQTSLREIQHVRGPEKR
ncbi:MAG TPA: helix-turn-helix domain-containing protein [Candidatus Dormibacteraeota bacterium]|nr:helix-turn-helix domain-containing protein [Candidatus Dormibacteraeota bacterium]